jgi:hypothetical protein
VKAGEFARVIKVNASAGPAGAPRAQADDGGWVMTVGIPHVDANGTELSALDGQFVWSSYDPAREELSIASDPFGMHALYVTERDGKAYLSTLAQAGEAGLKDGALLGRILTVELALRAADAALEE